MTKEKIETVGQLRSFCKEYHVTHESLRCSFKRTHNMLFNILFQRIFDLEDDAIVPEIVRLVTYYIKWLLRRERHSMEKSGRFYINVRTPVQMVDQFLAENMLEAGTISVHQCLIEKNGGLLSEAECGPLVEHLKIYN
jgi:hypothetical protein